MSRIGKKPVTLTDGVEVKITDGLVNLTGPKGTLSFQLTGDIEIEANEREITFKRKNDLKRNRALHGRYRSLFQNNVIGVSEGYSKRLELVGVGYKAEIKDKFLFLNLGYSHPIVFSPPEGIKIEVPSQTVIVISGIDKQTVGQVAAKIRSFRKPEPYKGKGVKYSDEVIRRKAGKTAAK